MTESSELNCKNWPELNNEEVIHYYNEIKLKKVESLKKQLKSEEIKFLNFKRS